MHSWGSYFVHVPKVENDFLVLYQLGPHENFYKNLKKYLKGIRG